MAEVLPFLLFWIAASIHVFFSVKIALKLARSKYRYRIVWITILAAWASLMWIVSILSLTEVMKGI